MNTTVQPAYYNGVSSTPWQSFSKHVLQVPAYGEQLLAREMKKNPGPVKQFGLERIHWLSQKLGSWDVSSSAQVNLPGLTRILGNIPVTRATVSILAAWLYLFTFPAREYQAFKRQRPDDLTKETQDVAIRDLTSFALALFILDPLVRWINRNITGKMARIPLVQGLETLPYSEMAKRYCIRSANHLAALARNPQTAQGLRKALQELGDRNLSQSGFTLLKDRVEHFKKITLNLLDNPDQPELAKQAFNTLESMNKLVKQAAHEAVEAKNPTLLKSAKQALTHYNYTDFLSYYANRFRVPADLVSLVAVIGLAGWLPMAINNFFSLRAVERYKREHGSLPNPGGVSGLPHKASGLMQHTRNNLAFSAFKLNNSEI